ncbi:hypothetical protein [Dongia sp.]|uniref:hypothetical protein n=1 Tax=Dongia sp. TaxID=1977262 RepID=UPI0035B36F7A
MNQPEPLNEIAKSIWLDAQRAVEMLSFFQVGNEPAVATRIGNTGITSAAVLVRSAILESFCMALGRLSDPGGSDKRSIERAAEVMRASAPPTGPSERVEAWADFLAKATEIKASPAVGKLKTMRKYVIAHTIPKEFHPEHRPLFDEAFVAADLILSAAFLLGVATGIATVSRSALDQVWREHATAYFQQLTQISG